MNKEKVKNFLLMFLFFCVAGIIAAYKEFSILLFIKSVIIAAILGFIAACGMWEDTIIKKIIKRFIFCILMLYLFIYKGNFMEICCVAVILALFNLIITR